MKATFRITVKLDPAKKLEIVKAAQQLRRERSTAEDESSNVIPHELQDTLFGSVMECLGFAISDDDRCQQLGIELLGLHGPKIAEERAN
jgi:hypothetical protein